MSYILTALMYVFLFIFAIVWKYAIAFLVVFTLCVLYHVACIVIDKYLIGVK